MFFQFRVIITFIFLLTQSTLFANGITIHLSGGAGWRKLHHTDNLYLNEFVEHSYVMSNGETSTPFINLGAGYQWNRPFSKLPDLAINLGLSTAYLKTQVTGTNYPFINAGQFDTLDFKARDTSYNLLFDATFIYTKFQWQPYLLGGIGNVWNHINNYSESPTDPNLSAVSMPIPFANKTMRNFAYELGIGMQRAIYTKEHTGHLNLFADYRFINWGSMALAPSPLQMTLSGPNLGQLNTQVINAGLAWQFA